MENDDVDRARRGDAAAFERIVRATVERSRRIARRVLGNEADAHDVAQEGYTRAWVALREGQFRGTVAQIGPWLDRIVVRASLDELRGRARRGRMVDAARPVEDEPHRGQDQSRVLEGRRALEALGELSAEQRAAFVLRELEGFSIRETAEALECTDGAVEQRVLRAWAALRKRLVP